MWSGNVVGIRCCSATCYFTIDFGTSGNGMFQFLQYQYACAFTHYEAISVFIKRSGSSFGIIISFAQGFHCIKTTNSRFANNCFTAPGDNDIGFPQSNIVICVNNTISAACTCTDHCIIGATETISYRNLAGSDIQYHFGDKERVKSGGTVSSGKLHNIILESGYASNSTGKNYAYPIMVYIFFGYPGVLDSFITCNKGKLSKSIQLARFLSIKIFGRFKIFNFTGKPGFKFCNIKLLNNISA